MKSETLEREHCSRPPAVANSSWDVCLLSCLWQRRQHQTDLVRQQDQSVEDVRRRDDARTAMLVTRSGVHKVTRKGSVPESF